ncbi:NEDD8 ultimate buster 1-like isoform X3 [Tachypleus tridentatus]|uniref:NEDD8 ultimate buster 1-like isoform X3 n=1 Tax=Tachypleus tridentatus TaxID=6853 RepID=UPI003FD2D90E
MDSAENKWTDKIREKLNKEKIKLWLPPYTTKDSTFGNYPEGLVNNLSQECGIPPELVSSVLERLRSHALDKLAARNKFQQTGLATLRVKVIGENDQMGASKEHQSPCTTVEIGLCEKGQSLKDKIGQSLQVSSSCLKLITSGHVIQDDQNLQHQGIKHSDLVMALVLSVTQKEVMEKEDQELKLQRTREDAEFLSSLDIDDQASNQYLQVADQNGKVLQLPQQERKALSLAMTLHEKGRAAMKRKNYGEALVFFLEADTEFRKCTSQLLQSVDNYALLCLDITWCYLNLESIAHLPDAENRLKTSEECFRQSYGSNLERVKALKGSSGNESSLFTRLHLLQGIVAYYQNRKEEAKFLLKRVSCELSSLKVDDNKISEVTALGFSRAEARLGLRCCHGNMERTVQHIITKREEREQIRKREDEERKRKKKQKTLGKTLSGDCIDFCNTLVSMGFSSVAAKASLQQSNNNLSKAIEILQESDLLQCDDPDEKVAQVLSLGYEENEARKALKKHHGNLQNAIEDLINSSGKVEMADSEEMAKEEEHSPRTSGLGHELHRQAANRLADDIPEFEEDYLDLSLEEEAEFLKKYITLLEIDV